MCSSLPPTCADDNGDDNADDNRAPAAHCEAGSPVQISRLAKRVACFWGSKGRGKSHDLGIRLGRWGANVG